MENNLMIFADEDFGTVRIRYDEYRNIEINLEDAARGLGFVQVKLDRVPKSGDKPYTVVRWERVREYLDDIGYEGEVNKDAYIPEPVFYMLAMKASNEAAKKFQRWIAYVVIPSIRKHGYYAAPKVVENSKPVGNPDFPPELSRRWADVKTGEALVEAAKLTTDRKFREAIVRKAVYILTGSDLTPALPSHIDETNWLEEDTF